jgi:oligoribonuclease (3'-5' exoribonuclease)
LHHPNFWALIVSNRDDENKLNLSANSIAIEKLEKGMNSMQDMIKQLTEEIGKFKQNSRSTYTPESKERNCYEFMPFSNF